MFNKKRLNSNKQIKNKFKVLVAIYRKIRILYKKRE